MSLRVRSAPAEAHGTARSLDPAKLPGAVPAGFPASITPMLAVSADTPPEGPAEPEKDAWLYEIKWDGMRVVLFLDIGSGKEPVRLLTRRGNDCARQFPELTVAHQAFAAEQAVVDGEVAVLDGQGQPSFPLLQPRIMAADAGAIAHLARSRPVVFCAFDLLHLDGYDLRGVPLFERKRALEKILSSGPLVRFSEHFFGSGAEFFEAARAQQLEGIVAKRAASRYQSRRSPDWVKVKIASQQEFVVCGYTEGERESFGSLVLGLYEGGRLVHVGNVGTGFDNRMLRALGEQLGLLATSRSPFAEPIKLLKPVPVTWVRPERVCTVRFNSWTPDGRLRAPVFLGLRPQRPSKHSFPGSRTGCGGTPGVWLSCRRRNHGPGCGGRPAAQVHQPQQDLLPPRGLHQARRHPILRRRLCSAAPVSSGSASLVAPIPERDTGRVVLPEECAVRFPCLAAY